MDALTTLLRHIKLEPLIGGATQAAPSAAPPLTDAPITATTPGASAEGHADAAAPDADSAALVRAATARTAGLAQAGLPQAAIDPQDNAAASAYTRLSPGAAALSQAVTTAANSTAPMPAPLPVDVAGQLPSQVAQHLNTSLAQSGMFYESHLQQWVAGERSLASLHAEPQNRHAGANAPAIKGAEPFSPASASAAAAASEADTLSSALQTAPLIPDALQPVVREQLNALDFQRIVWQGEVWPQQHAELEIAEDQHAPREQDEGEGKTWLSTLRIDLPELGPVVVNLSLNDAGASVHLRAAPEALESLKGGSAAFRDALDAAGIALRQLRLESGDG